jgi:hypothetical protein
MDLTYLIAGVARSIHGRATATKPGEPGWGCVRLRHHARSRLPIRFAVMVSGVEPSPAVAAFSFGIAPAAISPVRHARPARRRSLRSQERFLARSE